MSLSIINILIFTVLFIPGGIFGGELGFILAHFTSWQLQEYLGLSGGMISVLGLTWKIHERFHFRPLCFLRCPKCHVYPPEGYAILASEWPWIVLGCPVCRSVIEFWMTRTVKPEDVSSEMPSYRLRWPEFMGWWVQIHSSDAEEAIQA